jgi:hypothetical protein
MENTGGVYNPGQQVEVNENGVWRPARIQNVANFTVRNSLTRGETNKPPNQVFAIGGLPNSTGANTHYMPGSSILFQGPHRWIKLLGTLVSKNYVVQIDGRTETVPHTRIRRVARQARGAQAAPQPQPQAAPQPQPQAAPQPQPQGADGNFTRGQLVEVNENGRWRMGQVNDLYDYTITNAANGTNLNKEVRQVRSEGGNANIMPGDRIQFQQGRNWLPGTLVAKNYIVVLDGTRYENVPHTRLRPVAAMPRTMTDEEFYRRMQEMRRQANIAAGFDGNNTDDEEDDDEDEGEDENGAPRAAAARPGVAFEVHNAFDEFKAKKFNTFMEIINRTTGTNTNFRNRERPLQPLIDYVNTSESFNENKESLSPEDKAELIRKKADIIQKINRIFTEIQGYSKYNENIDNITDCIQYVLMQSPDFIDAYINTFVVDCFKAYDRGSQESCVKGMYERVYLAFRDTVSTLCLDQIQGVKTSSLCKPDYIEIFDCFYETVPQELLNDFSREWYTERGDEELGKLTPEARIEDFVGFVKGRMNDQARFSKAEASIRRYANKEINILFGGKRRSRTIKKRQAKRVRKNKTIKNRKNKTVKKSKKPKKI